MGVITALARLIEKGNVVVLSGAGISTDSGIPDYRGTPGRVRRPPITYRDFVNDPAARRRYWARSHTGWRRIGEATPNPGHEALATLERLGALDGVITQNVDGLHQAAGSEVVVELHGSLDATVCLACGDRRTRLELNYRLDAANPYFDPRTAQFAPDGDADLDRDAADRFVMVDCLECQGTLKPDVVFFGENVPAERVRIAQQLVASGRSLLVLGSSLALMSGFRFVLAACRLGIPVGIVNRGPTRGDEAASVRIDGGLSETLTTVVQDLTQLAS